VGYVLVVERDSSLRGALVDLLEAQGFEVTAVADGLDGLAIVTEREPSLILLGEQARHTDDIPFLPLARRTTWAAIVVIGSGDETAMVRTLLQGADAYMKRPPDARELIGRVRALLRRCDPYWAYHFNWGSRRQAQRRRRVSRLVRPNRAGRATRRWSRVRVDSPPVERE